MHANKGFKEAIEMVRGARSILVTSHTRPDGDAIGSIMSLSRSIKAQAKLDDRECVVQPLLLSYAGDSYKFLLDDGVKIIGENEDESFLDSDKLNKFDLIIVVDTRARRQMPIIGDYLIERTATGKDVLVLDHHLSGDDMGTCQIIDTDAGAAGEIVYNLCRAADWPMDRKALEAVFVAICTDTGWFKFQNTKADSLLIASELVSGGVEVDKMYRDMFMNHDAAKLALMTEALKTLELRCDGKFAVMTITNSMMEECGANRSHIENIVNEPMQVGTVEVSMMCVEMEEAGKTRFSLRSKEYVDVNAVANELGGGGHARAAGVTVLKPMEEAKEEIIKAVEGVLKG